jgi:hypothetical protein
MHQGRNMGRLDVDNFARFNSLNRESCFDSPVNIPAVHDREDPNFIFDDPKHHAIVSDAEFPVTL